MKLTVLLFATLKDRAGRNRLELELPGERGTLGQVRMRLGEQHPALVESLGSAVASVNREFAFDADPVKSGDEIGFFPPVSGGAGGTKWPEIYRVTADPIDLDALTQGITSGATGAVCLFSGVVRGQTDQPGHLAQTAMLEYEAYEPMAVLKMQQVTQEIRERWPHVQGVAIVQRIGHLKVGEPTVLIACASGHRDQGCFEAARYGIDRLKEIVPVWKKEIGPDGQHWIEGNYQPNSADKDPI
jgi:molybdopterin synthase catalytic subunit/molybdopterin converting factor small subunit